MFESKDEVMEYHFSNLFAGFQESCGNFDGIECQQRAIQFFRRINETEEYPDYSVAYVAGALTQTLIHWFDCGFEPEISKVSTLTEAIISGQVYQRAINE